MPAVDYYPVRALGLDTKDGKLTSRGGNFAVNCPKCVSRGEPKPDTKHRLHICVDPGAKGFGSYHCLAGETEVLTRAGVRQIRDLAGGEHELVTSKGWVRAPVTSFGVQPLCRITLSRNGVERVIRATAQHRWFTRVSDASGVRWVERTTEQLRPGQRLQSVSPPRSGTLKPTPWGIAHGVVFGDGTREGEGCRVQLWADKDVELLQYFPLSPTSPVKTPGGVDGVLVRGLPGFFKCRPSLDESAGYLYGWLAGYFAADGCVSEDGMPTLASANLANLEFVQDLCVRLGVTTYGIKHQSRVGLGASESSLWSIGFSRKTLTEDFFLVRKHRERWLQHRSVRERHGWVVQSVTASEGAEEVFCAEVPEVHNFVLHGNILTGNCFRCGWKGKVKKSTDLDVSLLAGRRLRQRNEMDALMASERKVEAQEKARASVSLPEDFVRLHPGLHAYDYMIKRGVTPEDIEYYQLGVAGGRIVFPDYDEHGKLCYWVSRSYDNSNPKYLNATTTVRDEQIYNYGRFVREGFRVGTLVEGPISSIVAGRDAFAAYGTAITPHQIERIFALKLKRLYLSLDPDARKKAVEYAKVLVRGVEELYLVPVPKLEDPASMGREAYAEFRAENSLRYTSSTKDVVAKYLLAA